MQRHASWLTTSIGSWKTDRFWPERPTLAKRFAKWTQRHRAITASGASCTADLGRGSSVSNLYIREARDQALSREAETEKQKEETEKQLRIASSMRLAAQSQNVSSEMPIQSLLLAVEAIAGYRSPWRRGSSVGSRESARGAVRHRRAAAVGRGRTRGPPRSRHQRQTVGGWRRAVRSKFGFGI